MKIIILLLLLLSFSFCSSKTEKPIAERTLDGWAGHPNDPNKKPFEYYYMTSPGKASPKSIQRKSGPMAQSTCTDNALLGMSGDLIGKMIGDIAEAGSPASGFLLPPIQLKKQLTKSRENFEFIDLSILVGFPTEEESSNGNKKERRPIPIESRGFKECKPTATPIPDFPFSEWRECACLVYAHVKGGKETIVKYYKETYLK
ncbi:MAG TPA: hypothetical protein PK079_11600 [Leptospiraceae bacterium]|nr:hypothetical protein [Leptospiraceae bacterium]HMY31565.1 hypothetical protein [Leptospiraceae bacterium]HMZ64472.1 hypothetical protein [Leptospiraceae bacterium]HNA10427.1 hypothetical protein [Leptospiraceae bacterium]HNC01612.1 hypothetical protein [Leptospiraceae bacterium]